ncbi:MAG: translocation/assembly module TamB, partial [Actinobacillus minor]|nr:translocation/assembly module TamB [Actinobacillus minor]
MNDKTTEIQQEIQAEKSPDVVKPKKGKRWGKRILGGGVILSLSSLGFLATGVGQRSVLTLADKLLDQLSIGQVEGSLQNGLILSNTQYVMDGVNVQVGQANLHLDFGCLLKGEACVENIAIKDTQVIVDTTKLPPSKEEQPSEPFTELNLPLGVSVKNVALDNIHVNVD